MGPNEPLNPYQAPRAELDVAPVLGTSASLENAVAGRYAFTVGEVMGEAWRLTKGMKASFWGATVVIGLICLVVSFICGLIFGMVFGNTEGSHAVAQLIFNGLLGALLTPFTMGIQMMCVRRALGAPVSFTTAFSYFPKAGTALVGALLVMLLTYLGLALLIIPGIYLGIGYAMTIQLIGDQPISAWPAMETSRKAIGHKWWDVFGLFLLVGMITGASALCLVIPLIWTIPWSMMVAGVLYRRIFYAGAPVDPAVAVAASAPIGA